MNRARLPVHRSVVRAADLAHPLDVIERAPGEAAFYWRSDDRDVEVAGLGAIHAVDARGPGRFHDAAAFLESLAIDGDAGGGDVPVAVGGFAFADEDPPSPWTGFPALRFFVPRVLWVGRGSERRMILQRAGEHQRTPEGRPEDLLPGRGPDRGDPGETDDAACWQRRVRKALDAIGRGDLDKVVLARRRSLRWSVPGGTSALVRELAAARPSCFTFLVRWRGRSFVGSSPERLLRVRGLAVEADALAGTAPRGLSGSHDESLARELAASAKEQREHRIVVEAIRDSLSEVADVEDPRDPVLLELPEAHHLHTPLRAHLHAPSASALFDVAGRLHPTPAVCGAPRAPAWAELAREEPGRGWYGGAIGWVGPHGDGELAVALRAALVEGPRAHVWAGAGIVEGSEPAREYEETERKMLSILPLLERGDDECAA